MQINKIIYKKKKVTVDFSRDIAVQGSEITYNANDCTNRDAPPSPSFLKALEQLSEDVYGFVPLDLSGIKKLTVHTITIKRQKELLEVICSCTATTKFTNAPFNFNTPKINEKEDVWTDNVSDHILEVMLEAEKYVNGDYGQVDLFDEGDQEATEESPGMSIVTEEKEAVAA